MAFGLPIVTTRWRSVPEMLPPGYPGLVADQITEQIADKLIDFLAATNGELLRKLFFNCFTMEQHLTDMAGAIRSVEDEFDTICDLRFTICPRSATGA